MHRRKLLFFILLMIGNIVFSQDIAPKTYSKIKFVYEQKSNYHIDKDGVYADTLLLAFELPNVKYIKKTSPSDSAKTIGFIPFTDLTKENKKTIAGSLSHFSQRIEGIYDVNKNVTKLKISRRDTLIINILKKYFNESIRKYSYIVKIDYNKKFIRTNYPAITYYGNFDTELRNISFNNNSKTTGSYRYQNEKHFHINLVFLNETYPSKVMPNEVFSNNDFGVQKIISLSTITKLTSIHYE